MDTFLEFLLLFLKISIYPIAAFIICGLIIALCERIFLAFCGRSGRFLIYSTSIIGTPIHELGHAFMCLIFCHKINDMKLLSLNSNDGTLGYVEHSYNRKNPYAVIGNLFIGLGPIFSGLLFTLLIMKVCFPSAFDSYIMTSYNISIGDIFTNIKDILYEMLHESMKSNAFKIVGGVFLFAVSLHINLSLQDIKGSLSSLPLYFSLTLIISIIVYFIKESMCYEVTDALYGFMMFSLYLYTPVMISALLILCIGAIFFIFRKILRLH